MKNFNLGRAHARLKSACALIALLATVGCAAAPNPTAEAIASANATGTICAAPGIGIAPDGTVLQTTDCSDVAISNISDVVSSSYSRF